MHRVDGTSYWQNYDVQNLLVEYLEFLTSRESTDFWRVIERNISLSEKMFVTFHNCMLSFNEVKDTSLLQLWIAQFGSACLRLGSYMFSCLSLFLTSG